MLRFYYGLLIFVFITPVLSNAETGTISQETTKAIEQLRKRKAGFEEHLKQERIREEQRLAKAHKQKEIRKKYQEERERARRAFVRDTEEFPKRAYREFVERRRQKRLELEKARRNYAKMQKELRKIYEDEKYNISGKKEFNL